MPEPCRRCDREPPDPCPRCDSSHRESCRRCPDPRVTYRGHGRQPGAPPGAVMAVAAVAVLTWVAIVVTTYLISRMIAG